MEDERKWKNKEDGGGSSVAEERRREEEQEEGPCGEALGKGKSERGCRESMRKLS